MLALASPAIIAALLTAAVVPAGAEAAPAELVRRLLGLAAVLVAYRWRRHLGLAVLAGVGAYGLASLW